MQQRALAVNEQHLPPDGFDLEVNEHHTVIDFDEHGRRTFATRLVTPQATSEPAPHKESTRKRAAKKKKEA